MKMTLRTRLTVSFLTIALLTLVGGGFAWWGTSRMSAAADEAAGRLSDVALAGQLLQSARQQYVVQADTVINQDLKEAEAFEREASRLAEMITQLNGRLDAPEERAVLAQLGQASEAFNKVFREGITAEVKRELEGLLKKHDAESDALIEQLQASAEKAVQVVSGKLDKALATNDAAVIKDRLNQIRAADAMLFWTTKQYQAQADLIINQDLAAVERFNAAVQKMDSNKEALAAGLETPEERRILEELNTADEAYDAVFTQKVLPEVRRVLEKKLQALDEQSDQYLTAIEEYAGKLANSTKADAQAALGQLEATRTLVRRAILGCCIASLAFGAVLGLVMSGRIAKPLGRAVSSLQEGATQVSDAAGQVSSAAQKLAEGASGQASALEETSSALEQMAANTRANSASSEEANALAAKARETASQGDGQMQQLNQAMQAINESSGQIGKIIKVIEEISFQTNLLALNAAVEAARAGEHGKGFAVVAEEVRNLAQRAAGAARETTGLIDDAVTKARQGTAMAEQVAGSLSSIVVDASKVSDVIAGIAEASRQQADGIEQVNRAVSQMNEGTQANASAAEESAAAAEQLTAQSQSVQVTVGELSALLSGRGA